jgi:hypothetical protein
MGGYAIDAAKAVYAQAKSIGLSNVLIGITPMVRLLDMVRWNRFDSRCLSDRSKRRPGRDFQTTGRATGGQLCVEYAMGFFSIILVIKPR